MTSLALTCHQLTRSFLAAAGAALLLLAQASVPARAGGEVSLFTGPGQAIAGYADVVSRLRPGDRVRFSDGAVFELLESLDREGEASSTARIWKVRNAEGEVRALRFPTATGPFPHAMFKPMRYEDFINETIDGYRFLKDRKIPAVEVFSSLRSEYVEVEWVRPEFSFGTYLNSRPMDLRHPDRPLRDFFDFVRSTAHARKIGDFKPEQLHYVKGRGWVLLDWTSWSTPMPEAPLSAENVFSPFAEQLKFYGPRALLRWTRDLRAPVGALVQDVWHSPRADTEGEVLLVNGKPLFIPKGMGPLRRCLRRVETFLFDN